jgi:thermitase
MAGMDHGDGVEVDYFRGELPGGVADSCAALSSERNHYYYRPGELIVAREDLDRITARLGAIGLQADQADALDDLLLLRIDASEPAHKIANVVSTLRELDQGTVPRVGPNHLHQGATHIQLKVTASAPSATTAALQLDPRPPETATNAVTIGLLDTGFDQDASKLAQSCSGDPEAPVLHHDGTLEPFCGHGTFAAGVALQYAPEALVEIRSVFDITTGLVDDFALAKAMRSLRHVDVLVFCSGGYAYNDRRMMATAQELRLLYQHNPDVVVVAAAGNEGTDRPFFPAAYKRVIAVGAVQQDPWTGGWRPACFSNYGWWVDASAEGLDVVSTFFDVTAPVGPFPVSPQCRGVVLSPEAPTEQRFTGKANWSGTSFAAPAVAGRIANLLIKGRTANQAVNEVVWTNDPTRRIRNLGALTTPGDRP